MLINRGYKPFDLQWVTLDHRMGHPGQELEETSVSALEKLKAFVVKDSIDFPVIVAVTVLADILEGGGVEVGMVVRGWQCREVEKSTKGTLAMRTTFLGGAVLMFAGFAVGFGRETLAQNAQSKSGDPKTASGAPDKQSMNIYVIPEPKEFGTSSVEMDGLSGHPRFTNAPAQQGSLPLKFPISKLPDGFWFRVPEVLGSSNRPIETERMLNPPKQLTFFSVEDARRWFSHEDELTSPGGIANYLIDGEAKASTNKFILILPKAASLAKLQELYPKRNFKFDKKAAEQYLTDSMAPRDEVPIYIDLLRRGGAIFIQAKDGRKGMLTVQPGGRLVTEFMK